jgi:O-antigen chain-terminating bifunctional methyltransferase/kinase
MSTHSFDQDKITTLRTLLKGVEFYQPIYGLEDVFTEEPCRPNTKERAEGIKKALGDVNGKHILDVGSSLGYMDFFLADHGAITEGWDFKAENVVICDLIKDIIVPQAPITFKHLDFNPNTVETIANGQFDVILLLSVLHHITAAAGIEVVQNMLKSLIEKSPTLIVELASSREYASEENRTNSLLSTATWLDKLPENDMDFFSAMGNVKIEVIGEHVTHVSTVLRKTYIITRQS